MQERFSYRKIILQKNVLDSSVENASVDEAELEYWTIGIRSFIHPA